MSEMTPEKIAEIVEEAAEFITIADAPDDVTVPAYKETMEAAAWLRRLSVLDCPVAFSQAKAKGTPMYALTDEEKPDGR